MATQRLSLAILDTHDINTICVVDASTYTMNPPDVVNPILNVVPPGYNFVELPFNVLKYNILTSDLLGISDPGKQIALPDGVYLFTYTVGTDSVKLSHMRVDALLEKYYTAFMNLDMMECNQAIKTQAKVDLSTIYLLIQGSISAASNCATLTANELYQQASRMLDRMIKHNCGCTGNNYIVNYK